MTNEEVQRLSRQIAGIQTQFSAALTSPALLQAAQAAERISSVREGHAARVSGSKPCGDPAW